MQGLSGDLVELKLPIKPGNKPVNLMPKRFAPGVMCKIKEEIERLLKRNFIRKVGYYRMA